MEYSSFLMFTLLTFTAFYSVVYSVTVSGSVKHELEISESFDYFMFAQAWPTAVCIEGHKQKHHCSSIFPTKDWIIHGLWPSNIRGKEPSNCNTSEKFNETAIQELLPQLQINWPNLYIDTPKDDFWIHEWTKHGTCAGSINATANEYLYFNQGLNLHKQINLTGLMTDLGYIPNDDKIYNVSVILEKLKGKLHGIEPVISCLHYKDNHILASIEICFSKSFQMMDCMENKNLYFKSIHHKSSRNIEYSNNHLIDCPKSGNVTYPTIHSAIL